MAIMAIRTPQDVIDAWGSMEIAAWAQKLPGLAPQQNWPSSVETSNAGDIGACSVFNSPQESSVIWDSDGDATITLSSLKIATMAGVRVQTAVAADAATVHLPLSFAQLEISGNYGYSQPCACYDFGKKIESATASGSGTIAQTISDNSLYYVANVGDTLSLSAVVVNGTPTVSVHPDTGGWPDWLAAIAKFFSVFKEEDALRAKVQNVFLNADFSKTMITLINARTGG